MPKFGLVDVGFLATDIAQCKSWMNVHTFQEYYSCKTMTFSKIEKMIMRSTMYV